jgi:ribosomal protein S18 acetylase RimI-like enzyme
MYANRESYTRLLLGPRYALLRREFQERHMWRRDIPPSGRRLLVTMGGSDPDNLTRRLIEALPEISVPDLEITIVAGGSNPRLSELQHAIRGSSTPIHLMGDASNMPELVAQADAAIICAGGTLWELLCMGCPTLSYFRTSAQGEIVAALDALGALHNLGSVEAFEHTSLICAVEELMACRAQREKMSQVGRSLVDGKGIARVLGYIRPGGMKCPALSVVQPHEREDFLEMALQHFHELNPVFTPAPDWKKSYFENIARNPRRSLRWIVSDGQHVGFILFGVEEHRFLPRLTGAIYEMYVIPEQRRKGIARACAKQVLDDLWKSCPSKIQLEVVEGNAAAAELWRSLGFQKVTERFVLTQDTR